MRREAVDLWFALYPSISMDDFVAELGYPSRTCLSKWVREDPRFDPDKPRYDSKPLLTKLEAIRRVADGEPFASAARACGVSDAHVRRLVGKFAGGGAAALLPAPTVRRAAKVKKRRRRGPRRPRGRRPRTSRRTSPTTRPRSGPWWPSSGWTTPSSGRCWTS